jgi:hypothetical protein
MGRWIPCPGTIYRTLLDQAIQVFGINEIPADNSFVCYSLGPICTCLWTNGEFHIAVNTPQAYGQLDYHTGLSDWLSLSRPYWSRTTGFLHVSRMVRNSAPHLEWINPTRIANGFGVSLSPIEIGSALTTLQTLIAANQWFSPQLRHDGVYDFVPTPMSDPRAVRLISLSQNAKSHVFVGEAATMLGIGIFARPRGYVGGLSPVALKMSEEERFETFSYEFELAGQNSYDFSLA